MVSYSCSCAILLLFASHHLGNTNITETFKPILVETDLDETTIEYLVSFGDEKLHFLLTHDEEASRPIPMYTVEGGHQYYHQPKGCHLQGTIIGKPNSIALFSHCHGLRGYFEFQDILVYVGPVDDSMNASISDLHKLDIFTPSKDGHYHSNHHRKPSRQQFQDLLAGSSVRDLQSLQTKRTAITGYLKLSVIVSTPTYNDPKYGKRSAALLSQKFIDDMKGLQILVEKLGLRLSITKFIIDTKNRILKPFFTYTPPSPIFDSCKYARSLFSDRDRGDVTIVSTPWNPQGAPEIGWATQNSICDRLSACILIRIDPTFIHVYAMAHQLGHTMGMNHPVMSPKECSSCWNSCVMRSRSAQKAYKLLEWTPCDIRALSKLLAKKDCCLLQKPTVIAPTFFRDPLGDKFLSVKCSCGFKNVTLEQTCCDKRTCTLMDTPECSAVVQHS